VSIYDQFGVRPIINGVGPATRLGGTVMDDEVLAAMADAAKHYVKIDELQDAAGRFIGEITGAESGYVTSGAAAGLALATAACMTGLDPVKINQLPDARGMKNEVIIHRTHRYDYDHAFRSVGAMLVEFGFPDAVHPYELEAAISENTAAVAYYPTPNRLALPLDVVVEIAHHHDVPVIVDAALEVPPMRNLRTFVEQGADVVVFSGGKAFRGPQASGFLCGRADLVRAIGFHHQDMDVHPETWTYRDLIAEGIVKGPPHHGIGRQMKVGKEEILGLLVALRRYVQQDRDAEQADWKWRVEAIAEGLGGIPGVEIDILGSYSRAGVVPSAVIRLNESRVGRTAFEVLEALQEGEPRIFLNEERAWDGLIVINPMELHDEDLPMVVGRVREVLLGVS
jgi:L-seryl-tRNA(Ser) seleniumtransferase